MATYVILTMMFLRQIHGHGYLVEPPPRNSMWRYGYKAPINYNDNELNCGGRERQWLTNGGKCGVCGDAYDQQYPQNVYPGEFATGLRPRRYQPGGYMHIKVKITANHKGYFTFKVGEKKVASIREEDLKYKLDVVKGSSTTDRVLVPSDQNDFEATLKLPNGLTCDHCVLQWTYRTGNSWGCDGTTCGIGFGSQETFVNCADIVIEGNPKGTAPPSTMTPSTSSTGNPTPASSSESNPTAPSSTAKTTQAPITQPTEYIWKCNRENDNREEHTLQTLDNICQRKCSLGTDACENVNCTCAQVEKTKRGTCFGVPPYSGVPNMDQWCITNCKLGFCPKSHCSCDAKNFIIDCKVKPPFSNINAIKQICQEECAKGSCPVICECTLAFKRKLKCVGRGVQSKVPGMAQWCLGVCKENGDCGSYSTHCVCS